MAHHRNVASLSLSYRYYFGRCSSELAQLAQLPFLRRRSTHYSDRLHDFSVTIPRCYNDVYVNSIFLFTARLWNSLPIECFPLTYDLNSMPRSGSSALNGENHNKKKVYILFLFHFFYKCIYFLVVFIFCVTSGLIGYYLTESYGCTVSLFGI